MLILVQSNRSRGRPWGAPRADLLAHSREERALVGSALHPQVDVDPLAESRPRLLAKAAAAYENAAVRRLGYLLDLAQHARQADALQMFAKRAKTALPMEFTVKPLVKALARPGERNPKWKLLINEALEIAE